MKTKKASTLDLRDLMARRLGELLDGEKQLIKALPKLTRAATSEELRAAMEAHQDQTEEHVHRLEQVINRFHVETPSRCAAMKAMIDEAVTVIEYSQPAMKARRRGAFASSAVLDAALIGAAQQVEHYEIATYGTLCAWAKVLEEDEAVSLLQETLEEEKATDEELTDLAERVINPEAAEDDFDAGGVSESVNGAQTSLRSKPKDP
jgi:ferritin-like metal-binding protein YciE